MLAVLERGEGRQQFGMAISVFDADGALSREFLLERGYCCGNGCRNCPYGFHDGKASTASTRSTPPQPRVPESRD